MYFVGHLISWSGTNANTMKTQVLHILKIYNKTELSFCKGIVCLQKRGNSALLYIAPVNENWSLKQEVHHLYA